MQLKSLLFALLPQGQVERKRRARAMVRKMDELGFGNCTNTRYRERPLRKAAAQLLWNVYNISAAEETTTGLCQRKVQTRFRGI